MKIVIKGVISKIEDGRIEIVGINPNTWKKLPGWYNSPGVRRRIKKGGRIATVKLGKSMTATKKGELVGLDTITCEPVVVFARISKYRFGEVVGWSMSTSRVEATSLAPSIPPDLVETSTRVSSAEPLPE
jgi:hypothetical protein